jgi:hypothetical protein
MITVLFRSKSASKISYSLLWNYLFRVKILQTLNLSYGSCVWGGGRWRCGTPLGTCPDAHQTVPSVCCLAVYVVSVLDHGKGVCADPRRGDAILGVGGPGPQRGMRSISWVWTGEERRHSKMTEDKEDGSITASRNDHAQSKCHCASGSHSVTYSLWELYFIVLLFQENKSFGPSCQLHSSSDVREAVSRTVSSMVHMARFAGYCICARGKAQLKLVFFSFIFN